MPLSAGFLGDATATAAAAAAQATADAAQTAVDAVEVKTDHLAFTGGDLVVDVDLVPNGNETLTLGKSGANFLRVNTVDSAYTP